MEIVENPNILLSQIRQIVSLRKRTGQADVLVELIERMDERLTMGKSLPFDWAPAGINE